MRRLVLLSLMTLLAACGDDPQERLSLRTPPVRSSAEPLPQAERAAKRAERAARAPPRATSPCRPSSRRAPCSR
jgi:hypothetical protein